MLSDGDRVRNLLGLYGERMDAGDFEGVGDLFERGVLADIDGRPIASGAEEVAVFYAGGVQLHDGSPRTRHLVTNTVLSDRAGDGSVTARSAFVVLQLVGDGSLHPIAAGRYVDRFEQDDHGTWRFSERRFALDLVGDLSRHWGGPT